MKDKELELLVLVNRKTLSLYSSLSMNKDIVGKECEVAKNLWGKVNDYFRIESETIMKKCINKVVAQIKSSGKKIGDTNLMGDDYTYLNAFEQLCVIYSQGDPEMYGDFLDAYIDDVCKGTLESLSTNDITILNEEFRKLEFDEEDNDDDFGIYFENIQIELRSKLISFMIDYTSRNIEKTKETL